MSDVRRPRAAHMLFVGDAALVPCHPGGDAALVPCHPGERRTDGERLPQRPIVRNAL